MDLVVAFDTAEGERLPMCFHTFDAVEAAVRFVLVEALERNDHRRVGLVLSVVAIVACRVGTDANVVCHCASARDVSSSLPLPASKRVRVSLVVLNWLSALRIVSANWSCKPRKTK